MHFHVFVVQGFYAFCNPPFEAVAKSIKASNHEGHEEHKGKEKLFFVLFVSFVVPFFSGPFAAPFFEGVAKGPVTAHPRRQPFSLPFFLPPFFSFFSPLFPFFSILFSPCRPVTHLTCCVDRAAR